MLSMSLCCLKPLGKGRGGLGLCVYIDTHIIYNRYCAYIDIHLSIYVYRRLGVIKDQVWS